MRLMEKELDMDSFVACWKEFVKAKNDELFDNFDKPAERTRLVLGDKSSSIDNGSPFGDHFRNYFSNKYSYRKEDGSVDLSIYKSEFIENVSDMKIEEKVSNITQDKLNNFPKVYSVLLEQENVIERAYEEMHKLTYFRANLKVLVTYIWNPSKTGDKWAYAHDRICKNFESILKQTNDIFPENGETDYILVTGQKVNEKLIWKYTGFQIGSFLKQVQSYVITNESYNEGVE